MMQTTRIEDNMEISTSADSSCSAYWLMSSVQEELSEGIARITAATELKPWGFLGRWEESKFMAPRSSEIAQSTRLDGEFRIGSTTMLGNVLELFQTGADWFWSELVGPNHKFQICAALVPDEAAVPSPWSYAGLQLVLISAAKQARPGASHDQVLRTLSQAFISETLNAGGIVVTRLVPELLGPGVAVTGKSAVIDQVAGEFQGLPQVQSQLLKRSRSLET